MKNKINAFIGAVALSSTLSGCAEFTRKLAQLNQPKQQRTHVEQQDGDDEVVVQRQRQDVADQVEKVSDPATFELPSGEEVMFYQGAADQEMTPEEYLEYLTSNIQEVADVAAVLDALVEWDHQREDRLYSAKYTLSEGHGDCDNMAEACKEMLQGLGERIGHDFDPIILGMDGHAVCLFNDVDGERKSVDAHELNVVDDDLASASRLFDGRGGEIVERLLTGQGQDGEIFLERTLKEEGENVLPDYTDLKVIYFGKYEGQRVNDFVLPGDWKKYETTTLFFMVDGKYDARLYYEGGKLVQITYGSDELSEYYYDNGVVRGRQYDDGTVEFFRKEGTLGQKDLPNGDSYQFAEDGETVTSIHYADGHWEIIDEGASAITIDDIPEVEINPDSESRNVPEPAEADRAAADKEDLVGGGYVLFFNSGDIEQEVYGGDGILERRSFADGRIILFYEDGDSVQMIQYEMGDVYQKYFRRNGTLEQERLQDGTTIIYDDLGERGIWKILPDGTQIEMD